VPHGIARLADAAVPEDAVAYDADGILALLDAAGFDAEWRPGAWCPRDQPAFDYQDLVVATRRGVAHGRGGARGAVTALSGGALRGWAQEADGGPAPLSLRIGGAEVARSAPRGGAEFALDVPPELLGRRVRDLAVLAGAEGLPLLARPAVLLADPVEELARAWRVEAVRQGAWRIDSLDWRPDGAIEGLAWAIPPRGAPPDRAPHLLAGGARVPLVAAGPTDDALGAALGLPPGVLRPGWRFRIEAGLPLREVPLCLVGADGVAWGPLSGHRIPLRPPGGPLAGALDALALAAAMRAATGLSLAGVAPRLELAADAGAGAGLADAPAGAARLVLAPDGLDLGRAEDEAALVAALARAAAPGAPVLAAMPGALALIGGAGGTARLLGWLRDGLALAPEAPPGHRAVRAAAHLRAAWGCHFDLLRLEEGALSGLRDLVVLRRR
jgi:hypothetical protein